MTRQALALLVLAGCYHPSNTPPTCVGESCVDAPATDSDGPLLETCLHDNFNSGLDTARWDKVPVNAIVETPDQELSLVLPMDTTNGKVVISSSGVFDLTENRIQVELVQPPSADAGLLATRLVVVVDSFSYTILHQSSKISGIADEGGDASVPISFDSHLHRHWQIRHAPGMVIFETSADRVDWSTFHTVATTAAFTNARIRLELEGSTGTGGSAQFDNVELVSNDCPTTPDLPIIIDSFFDNGALESHSADSGASWSLIDGAGGAGISVASRAVFHSAGNRLLYASSATAPSADYDVEADFQPLQVQSGTVGISARTRSPGIGYVFGVAITAAPDVAVPFLQTFVTGNVANLTCDNVTPIPLNSQTGRRYRLRLRVRGTSITGWIDGVRRCVATDNTLTVPGSAGMLFSPAATNVTGTHLDNFRATDALL